MSGTAAGSEQGGASRDKLGTSLKSRHITMISIAGIIGAGLFVGSANAIAEAGPAVILSYIMAGTLVVLVMRMLGEMATANPDTGSFSVYADRALGGWAGFSIGWLYWWFWVLVIPVEATAAADILTSLIGGAQWIWALAVTLLLTITNLASVGNYGEFEFWFALIKVSRSSPSSPSAWPRSSASSPTRRSAGSTNSGSRMASCPTDSVRSSPAC